MSQYPYTATIEGKTREVTGINPIVPFNFKRGTWAYVDAAAAVLLLLSVAVMDVRKPRP